MLTSHQNDIYEIVDLLTTIQRRLPLVAALLCFFKSEGGRLAPPPLLAPETTFQSSPGTGLSLVS